jgi:hypothetical protein
VLQHEKYAATASLRTNQGRRSRIPNGYGIHQVCSCGPHTNTPRTLCSSGGSLTYLSGFIRLANSGCHVMPIYPRGSSRKRKGKFLGCGPEFIPTAWARRKAPDAQVVSDGVVSMHAACPWQARKGEHGVAHRLDWPPTCCPREEMSFVLACSGTCPGIDCMVSIKPYC